MADNLSELRRSILGAINRETAEIDARLAYEVRLQVTGPVNAQGGSISPSFDGTLSTGYNSGTGTTTVPFTWGISLWGSSDIWTHS